MKGRIVLREGDLAAERADAIVNAAGSALALAGGDVIHVAGLSPRGQGSEESVRSLFRLSLELARERGCRTIAVPAIGAGIAGLPLQRCAEVLLEEARTHLAGETSLEEIRFVLKGEPVYRVFEQVSDASRIAEQMARLTARRGGPEA